MSRCVASALDPEAVPFVDGSLNLHEAQNPSRPIQPETVTQLILLICRHSFTCLTPGALGQKQQAQVTCVWGLGELHSVGWSGGAKLPKILVRARLRLHCMVLAIQRKSNIVAIIA